MKSKFSLSVRLPIKCCFYLFGFNDSVLSGNPLQERNCFCQSVCIVWCSLMICPVSQGLTHTFTPSHKALTAVRLYCPLGPLALRGRQIPLAVNPSVRNKEGRCEPASSAHLHPAGDEAHSAHPRGHALFSAPDSTRVSWTSLFPIRRSSLFFFVFSYVHLICEETAATQRVLRRWEGSGLQGRHAIHAVVWGWQVEQLNAFIVTDLHSK